jgi:hypothetical protein
VFAESQGELRDCPCLLDLAAEGKDLPLIFGFLVGPVSIFCFYKCTPAAIQFYMMSLRFLSLISPARIKNFHIALHLMYFPLPLLSFVSPAQIENFHIALDLMYFPLPMPIFLSTSARHWPSSSS